MNKVGHVAAVPGPLACPSPSVRPLAWPSRSARPPGLSYPQRSA